MKIERRTCYVCQLGNRQLIAFPHDGNKSVVIPVLSHIRTSIEPMAIKADFFNVLFEMGAGVIGRKLTNALLESTDDVD